MSISLRVLLIIASVINFIYIGKKLRKSEVGLMDTVFWIVLGFVFILISVFPGIAIWGAEVFGIIAPVNFIFLIIIFLLLMRNFLLTVRLSKLEERLQHLVQEIAIRENEKGKENE